MSQHKLYLQVGKEFHPSSEAISKNKLPAGSYFVNFDPESQKIWFTEFDIQSDELVDLPGTAYDLVAQDLQMFLTQDCEKRYGRVNIIHKMNILLFGAPGTGKSCIVHRVAKEIIADNGVVFFNPNPELLKGVYAILDKLQPETRALVIFEELDQLIEDYEEGAFLHILDGEIQKKNAMYIATTNYVDQIPMRIRRPGRFALRVEVGFPNLEARLAYLNSKLKDTTLSSKIAEMTAGFSVDNLKEVVRAHVCMLKNLDKVVQDLRTEFHITETGPQNPADLADGGSDDNGPFRLKSPTLKRR